MKRTITMTQDEIQRCKVMQMASERRISQKQAALRLGISERQVRRIMVAYREGGDEALVSGHRGKPSNNRMEDSQRQAIVALMKDEIFTGFGPTLLSEKIEEYGGICVSKETVRQIMIEEGLHRPKTKKRLTTHPMREARARRGELVQIDGSYHAWLEDRGPKACLLLFVDDATHEILAARFVAQETYFAYADLCATYFKTIGLPVSFYSDRFSVFRVNHSNAVKTDAITQFGRALQELGVELICANSPQAKGRVERANQTFQDRLVKELRLQRINDYQQANAFLPTFVAFYNRKFAVLPRSLEDAHSPLDANSNLEKIFSIHQKRIISKDLHIQFNHVIYRIITKRPVYALQGRSVMAVLNPNGQVSFYLNDQLLTVEEIHQQPKQAEIVSAKSVEHTPNVPPANHPWRNYGSKINTKPVPVASQ
jgi:transposase